MKDPDDDINLGCIPPEKKHQCPRCQELLPMDEMLRLSFSSFALFPVLYYYLDWYHFLLCASLLFPFTWVCSLRCTKCREYLHLCRYFGLARKAARSECCGKRIPAAGWMAVHFIVLMLVAIYTVFSCISFASWESFQRDCGSEALSRDYQGAMEVFNSSYCSKLVRWHGTFYSGWYLGETSKPFPDHYEACIEAMMDLRSPPEADFLFCMSKKLFQEVNNTVRIGAKVSFVGKIEYISD